MVLPFAFNVYLGTSTTLRRPLRASDNFIVPPRALSATGCYPTGARIRCMYGAEEIHSNTAHATWSGFTIVAVVNLL